MRMQDQTYAYDSSRPGSHPARKRRRMSRLRSAVRARSALLCAALVAALVAGRHPQALLERIGLAHPGALDAAALSSLETLTHDAQAAEAAGHAAEAARLQALLCTQYPQHPAAEWARLQLARDLADQGDFAGAVGAFQKFRLLHPESRLLPPALLEVAGWQYEVCDYLGAAHTYTDLIALVTRPAAGRGTSEDAAPAASAWPAARRRHRGSAARLDPERLERLARFNQAVCLERGGNRDGALRAYDRFMSRFPEDARVPEAHFQMGTLLLESQDPQGAVRHFRAVWESPESAPQFRSESIYRAGRAYESLLQAEDAIATLRLAIELRPANDEFRLAALARLALLVQERQPLLAVGAYRDIAASSKRPAWRAAALERMTSLENEPTVADAGR